MMLPLSLRHRWQSGRLQSSYLFFSKRIFKASCHHHPSIPTFTFKSTVTQAKICPIPGQAPGCFGGNNRMLTPSSWSSVRGGDSTVWGSGLLNFPVIPLGKSSSSFLGKENGHHLVLFRCKGCLWSCGSERA